MKMKPTALIYLFITLLLLSKNLYSQNKQSNLKSDKKKDQGLIHLKIGAKGGVSLNSLQGNYGLSHDYLATEGGLATELIIGGNFLVEVDVMYQQRGGIRSTGTRHINYLGIPVLLKAFHPFGDSGTGALAPFISLGMNYQILQDSQFGKFTDNNIKDRNLSIVIAAGFAFQTPNNFMDFTFEWRYEQGITDIGVPSVLRTRSSSYLFGFMLKLF